MISSISSGVLAGWFSWDLFKDLEKVPSFLAHVSRPKSLSFVKWKRICFTDALLAKWIPPKERSRTGAVVYAGAQFGTIISMPISGLLAEHSWPLIFYVFGLMGVVWSLAFLWTVYEDPSCCPKIKEEEKNMINEALWGNGTADKSPAIPWKSIATSMPFYAILFAHVSLLIISTLCINNVTLFHSRWLKITATSS